MKCSVKSSRMAAHENLLVFKTTGCAILQLPHKTFHQKWKLCLKTHPSRGKNIAWLPEACSGIAHTCLFGEWINKLRHVFERTQSKSSVNYNPEFANFRRLAAFGRVYRNLISKLIRKLLRTMCNTILQKHLNDVSHIFKRFRLFALFQGKISQRKVKICLAIEDKITIEFEKRGSLVQFNCVEWC